MTYQIAGPRIIHGILAAITDIAVREVTRQVLNDAFVPTVVRFLRLERN